MKRCDLLKAAATSPVIGLFLKFNPTEVETIESRPVSFQFARIVSDRVMQAETALPGRPSVEEIGKAAARGMNYVWQYLSETTTTGSSLRVVHGVDFGG